LFIKGVRLSLFGTDGPILKTNKYGTSEKLLYFYDVANESYRLDDAISAFLISAKYGADAFGYPGW
jgi:hypothetical protein